MEKRIAVLSLQGAFIEHEKKLEGLGANCLELRKKEDLLQSYDALVLPGGESSVQGKLLRELELFEPLRGQIAEGLPVLATCAGMILLATDIANDTRRHFQTLPMTLRRNAYGRQRESFFTKGKFGALQDVPMEFIRAPYIENVGDGVEVLSVVNDHIVAVRYQNQLAMSFHPELCADDRVHRMFLEMV
jgi:5'-phosphate synthase pdxT subunit